MIKRGYLSQMKNKLLSRLATGAFMVDRVSPMI